MNIKVLFLDDIFSDLFRNKVDSEQLIFDDTWSESLEKELVHKKVSGIDFQIVD